MPRFVQGTLCILSSHHCDKWSRELSRNRKERQKNFYKARKTGVDNDTILVYDISTQTFESRPIAKAYGVINMYRDDRNAKNVHHLEQGLSQLENDAARVIRNIHTAVGLGKNEIRMKRRELETIRKFVYIMHYRRTSLLSSYFDENDPDNRSLKDYLLNLRQKHNLRNKDDIFLFGLKYLLDIPHHKIVETGEAIQEQYGGPKGVLSMLVTRVDPDINYPALDYMTFADSLFLGIWEAAEDEEFVIGSNSFGLYEGLIDGFPALHRLFVVSPKIALILRQTLFSSQMLEHLQPEASESIKSLLFDVPMAVAETTYANPRAVEALSLWKYRHTAEAQEDTYTFTRAKLTRAQTRSLNHILLLHLPDDGNLTFASPAAMKTTLEYHLQTTFPEAQRSKYWVRGLLGILNAIPTGPSTSTSKSVNSQSGIDVVLQAIANGAIEFRSDYDRAYRVYHLATDNIAKYNESSSEIHQMTARAIHKMIKQILPPLPHTHRNRFFPFISRDIVKELPKEESELFFALVGHQVDLLKVGPSGNDVLSRIKYEAAIIGFTHWLAENRPLVLGGLLLFWAKVLL